MATGRIGTTPVLTTRWSKAPSAGTTSLSGLDDNSVSLVYSVGYEAVYQNGVLLSRGNDYTATNGTTITLTTATVAGDIIEVFANQLVPLTDTYSQTVANGKFINNTLTTTTGDIIYASAANTPARLAIGSTDQVLKVSGGVPVWGAAPAASFVGCSAYNTSQSLSYTSDTGQVFPLPSENFDTDGFHSTTTNTSRMTIPTGKGGYYQINATIQVDSMSNYYRVAIHKNGSAMTEWANNAAVRISTGTGTYAAGTAGCANLSAGDYIEMVVQMGATGSYNTIGRLDLYKVG